MGLVQREAALQRRLPWLLVFRAVVATVLLTLNFLADYFQWPQRRTSLLLYAVIIGTYLMVLVVGLLLKRGTKPVPLSLLYLLGTVLFALMFVQGTGGIASPFSFLYLLAILDGSIIGGQRAAIALASACSVIYGAQLVLQLYGVATAGLTTIPPVRDFAFQVGVHMGAFYLVGLLSGYLAELLEKARLLASTAQQNLARARNLHSAVVESLPLGIIAVNESMEIRTANQAASNILSMPMYQLLGSVVPLSLRGFLSRNENFGEVELEVAQRKVSLALSRCPVQPSQVSDEGPQEELTLLVLEDRTEIRVLEEDLRVKQRLASIGELAAARAHELRNPLASMSGSVELLTRYFEEGDDKQTRLSNIVLREVAHLNRLVEEFLIFARPTPPVQAMVDVPGLCREVAEAVSHDPAWERHSLKLQMPDRLFARIDYGQVRRVIWNLLRNAVEASPDGRPVQLRVSQRDMMLVIAIEDEGPGIPSDYRDEIFEPFKTTKQGGTGLGLSICHRIVSAHGGRIDVNTGPDEGTRMEVVLPTRDDLPSEDGQQPTRLGRLPVRE